MSNYNATIKDGREIYIPSWPVDVQLENLTTVCKVLSAGSVINIAKLNIQATKHAVMNADDPREVARVIKHFVCQVRIDGNKITEETFETLFEGDLSIVVELFTHLLHSQYNNFFD